MVEFNGNTQALQELLLCNNKTIDFKIVIETKHSMVFGAKNIAIYNNRLIGKTRKLQKDILTNIINAKASFIHIKTDQAIDWVFFEQRSR